MFSFHPEGTSQVFGHFTGRSEGVEKNTWETEVATGCARYLKTFKNPFEVSPCFVRGTFLLNFPSRFNYFRRGN